MIVQTSVHFSEVVCKLGIPIKKICCSECDTSTDQIGTQILTEVMDDCRLCFLYCVYATSFFQILKLCSFSFKDRKCDLKALLLCFYWLKSYPDVFVSVLLYRQFYQAIYDLLSFKM